MLNTKESYFQLLEEIWETNPKSSQIPYKSAMAFLILDMASGKYSASANLSIYLPELAAREGQASTALEVLSTYVEPIQSIIESNENHAAVRIQMAHPDFPDTEVEFYKRNNNSLIALFKPDLMAFKTLKLALDSGNIGIWEWDLVTNQVKLDEAWYSMMNYPEGSMPDLSSTWQSMVHPDDMVHLKNSLEESIQDSSKSFESEHRIKDANGAYRWVLIRGRGVVDGESKTVNKLIGIHKDIAARKAKELEHERTKEFLERSNNIAGIGYWEVDLVNQKVHWSNETKRIHGVPVDYIPELDKAINFFPEGKHRDRIIELVEKAINENEYYDEVLQILTLQGDLIWVRAVGIPDLVDGTTVGIYGLFQNINKSMLIEHELSKSETLFRKTFEHSSIGMALVSLEGQWLRVNGAVCRFLEYDEEELKKLSFQDITHADDLNLDLELLQECLDGKREYYQMEKRYLTKSGQSVWALLAVSLVRTEEGEPLHFISQITNIDASKKLVERVKDQNERLLNFAHIVSHNLRSHATNTALMLEMLALDIPEAAKLQSYQHMIQASNNLAETIHYLNEITAMQLQTNEHLEALDIKSFVQKNLKALERELSLIDGKIELDFQINSKVIGVAAYVDSILYNLLSNTLKYRSPDRPLVVQVSCRQDHEAVHIDITDNGIGIDLERNGDKLFGLYKTFHQNEDAKGVGLFISKNQAEAMGGSLVVKSKEGQGSTFTLSLNRAAKYS